jgi:unsaturated rhamnogalacturonyl hydrolase
VRPLLILALLVAPCSVAAAERWTVGSTTNGLPIDALVVAAPPGAPTVLLIGGLSGNDPSVATVTREVAAVEALPQARRRFRLLAVPVANPDARPLLFPPEGMAYREHVESNVLWRWIGTHAPDLVLIAGPDEGLATALARNAVADVGPIPARPAQGAKILQSLTLPVAPSPARLELERRAARTPQALASELARIYGHDFARPNYIAAMALISRLRLGEQAEVMKLAAPFLEGTTDSFDRPSQSALAAHMLFFELARRTGDERARTLVVRAASSAFTEAGALREFMPLHGGWSDSMFMDVPILAKAGALTGDRRFFDMAARHIAFMQRIVLRPDGLYRHQASAAAAWGRGNAFAALGLALTLSDFPADHPASAGLLASFRQHMAVLARFQDENGMWRNVIDRRGAYDEYSATAMIGAAMQRGIRNGWLDAATYRPLVDAAWRAIAQRSGSDGRLVDVCESTGTRGMSDDDYFHRMAILGRDDRGGGMAMFFATELAGLD